MSLELGHWRMAAFRGCSRPDKTDLLILDDWGPDRLDASNGVTLWRSSGNRYEAGINSNHSHCPSMAWHDVSVEPTFADAILDRLVSTTPTASGFDGSIIAQPKSKLVTKHKTN